MGFCYPNKATSSLGEVTVSNGAAQVMLITSNPTNKSLAIFIFSFKLSYSSSLVVF